MCVCFLLSCVCFQCMWEHEYVLWSTYWSCVDLGVDIIWIHENYIYCVLENLIIVCGLSELIITRADIYGESIATLYNIIH